MGWAESSIVPSFFTLFPVCGMDRKERIALKNSVSLVCRHIIDVVAWSQIEITGCSQALDKRTLWVISSAPALMSFVLWGHILKTHLFSLLHLSDNQLLSKVMVKLTVKSCLLSSYKQGKRVGKFERFCHSLQWLRNYQVVGTFSLCFGT